MSRIRILCVAGARPNFVKIAPVIRALRARTEFDASLVHTGQHYDAALSDLFFRQLEIPRPDVNLGVGSASHAVQTAEIMRAFEPVVADRRPHAVLVVGDVNSTIACGLVAVKLGVRLVHVEAGLRSFDRTMPEEINRLLTDAISDVLFCTEESGVRNLRAEGIPPERIFLVGNVMIDTLLQHREKADRLPVLEEYGLQPGRYAVLTLHRPANVDDPLVLGGILDALEAIQRDLPILFPIHPRARKMLESSGLGSRASGMTNLRLLDPVGYLEFLKLMSCARIVLTDSGGIQEETTILGVPCLTLRDNTERPSTVEAGLNHIVGRQPARILAAYREVMAEGPRKAIAPPLWDGHASERIAQILAENLAT